MRSPGRQLRNEEGAALLFVVLMLVTLIGLIAIAVDVGLWLTTRSEAQRAADAAALAGAGLYMNPTKPTKDQAEAEARRFAALNFVGRDMINALAPSDGGDVDVVVNHADQRVTVTIDGGTHPLFAQYLGWDRLPVQATAAARVFNAGGAKCVKPFALPDYWEERDQDTNGDRVWNNNESWVFDPGRDRYEKWNGSESHTTATGYGSAWRNGWTDPNGTGYPGDHGRPVTIKAGTPSNNGNPNNNPAPISPGTYLPFALPPDPMMPKECGGAPGSGGSGGNGRGGKAYKLNICECNNNTIDLDTYYEVEDLSNEPGGMVGPTNDGFAHLYGQDPGAHWDGSKLVSEMGYDSPRVIKVALYDPADFERQGRGSRMKFNNIALFFIEGCPNKTAGGPPVAFDNNRCDKQAGVTGRFLKFADGVSSSGPTKGSMVKVLQLVQ
jgi:Flp pilus assembly protein TadG